MIPRDLARPILAPCSTNTPIIPPLVDRIMHEQIDVGFMVFVRDGEEGVGSVREISHDRSELLVYIENAGDFTLPHSAVRSVHSGKVMLDIERLDLRLRNALRHARDSEDPAYVAPASEEDD